MLSRRKFLKLGGLAAASLAISGKEKIFAQSSSPKLDFVIRGGRSFVNGAWSAYDIGITAEGTMVVSKLPLVAPNIIDASNKIVSAGFIDILADNSANPERTFRVFEKYKVGDGVTTALQMHGGATDAGEYYKHFEAQKHLISYGVSTKVMNIRYKYNRLADRIKAIEKSLDSGALGVSHSPEYQSDTTWEEMVAYGKIAKKYDRPMFLHTRYSSKEKELDGVEEAINVAKTTGCRIHIDHLNSTGGTFNMEKALDMIRKARAAGLDITTCVYPYSYWATYAHSERFKEGWMQRYGMTYSDLEVVGTGERLTKESFNKYRARTGILLAAKEGVQPMDKTVKPALMEDFCMIGSDGGIETEPRANNHPRGAACFATAIRYAMDENIPLEKMLAKMTSRSCELIGSPMKNRGEIKNGYIADIAVFDPKSIRGAATNANPNQFSKSIDIVVVNGKITFDNGVLTGVNNGRSIKF
ncbi:MAG: amidohydrolase family protein [Prevotellaceae bacterium]|jgi:N-acyl-D-aspartate/D-glutamate deacylase|nr:amidohydrolase family protein [Prevotellaceae bacterium]